MPIFASGLPLALIIEVCTSIVVSFCAPSYLLFLPSKVTFFALFREALNPLPYQYKARIRVHTSTTMDDPDVIAYLFATDPSFLVDSNRQIHEPLIQSIWFP